MREDGLNFLSKWKGVSNSGFNSLFFPFNSQPFLFLAGLCWPTQNHYWEPEEGM